MGLDDLEALVHHRGAVDADLGAHRPVRMARPPAPGVAPRHLAPCSSAGTGRPRRSGSAAATPARRCRPGPGRSRCARNRPAAAWRRAGATSRMNRCAGADQAFLVGERHHGAAPHGGQGRPQARGADDAGHDPLGRPLRPPRPAPRARPRPRSRCRRALLERAVAGRIGDHGQPGAAGAGDRRQRIGPAEAGDRLDPVGSGASATRASVLRPIEPVAPSTVMPARPLGRRRLARRSRQRPRAQPSQTRPANTGAANISPSTRSSRPPWPGIRWPLSLTPARRLSAGFEQVAGLADHRQARRRRPPRTRSRHRSASAARPPSRLAPTMPPSRPAQVLPGLMRGASFGPPTVRPTK